MFWIDLRVWRVGLDKKRHRVGMQWRFGSFITGKQLDLRLV